MRVQAEIIKRQQQIWYYLRLCVRINVHDRRAYYSYCDLLLVLGARPEPMDAKISHVFGCGLVLLKLHQLARSPFVTNHHQCYTSTIPPLIP